MLLVKQQARLHTGGIALLLTHENTYNLNLTFLLENVCEIPIKGPVCRI